MRLGVCYMVFDGEELLEFAAKSIRSQVDHISLTYQSVSYWGNKADQNLFDTVNRLKNAGLIDEIIHFETDLSKSPKENELQLRNIGLEASRKAGCTHHISSDVDEFYTSNDLERAKILVAEENYDFTMVSYEVYYKEPTFKVVPNQKLMVSCIHPVDNKYAINLDFPFRMEPTRRFVNHTRFRVFSPEECTMHHMSYVRKNIYKKMENNDNKNYYPVDQLYENWENYKLGGRVVLLPNYLNRSTVQVENQFSIHF